MANAFAGHCQLIETKSTLPEEMGRWRLTLNSQYEKGYRHDLQHQYGGGVKLVKSSI